MKDKELLPCPFCGGKAELATINNLGHDIIGVVVRCKNCHSEGSSFKYGYMSPEENERTEKAIAAWNNRANSRETTQKLIKKDEMHYCSICGEIMAFTTLSAAYYRDNKMYNFCPNCGQALDWSGGTEWKDD